MRRHQPPRLRVGDVVRFPFGAYKATGRIIEDRGNIGVGGRRLVRVSVEIGVGDETIEFEIPADTCATDVDKRPAGRRAREKRAIDGARRKFLSVEANRRVLAGLAKR
jgi:hypothetical protein